MENIPKALIAIGATLIVVGSVWYFGAKFLKFGSLPGDIAIEKENFRFYFPIGTSILISLILSAAMWLFQKISK